MTGLVIRLALLVVGTGLCGALSGFFYPMMATRGAILGGILGLGLGVVWMVQRQANRPASSQLGLALTGAVAFGLLAGIVVTLYGTGGNPIEGDFPPHPTTSMPLAVSVCVIYALGFYTANHLRWRGSIGWFRAMLLMIATGVMAATMRFMPDHLPPIYFDLEDLTFTVLFAGIPFAFLWGLIAVLALPACHRQPSPGPNSNDSPDEVSIHVHPHQTS